MTESTIAINRLDRFEMYYQQYPPEEQKKIDDILKNLRREIGFNLGEKSSKELFMAMHDFLNNQHQLQKENAWKIN